MGLRARLYIQGPEPLDLEELKAWQYAWSRVDRLNKTFNPARDYPGYMDIPGSMVNPVSVLDSPPQITGVCKVYRFIVRVSVG